jgi:hypothetical protein
MGSNPLQAGYGFDVVFVKPGSDQPQGAIASFDAQVLGYGDMFAQEIEQGINRCGCRLFGQDNPPIISA